MQDELGDHENLLTDLELEYSPRIGLETEEVKEDKQKPAPLEDAP